MDIDGRHRRRTLLGGLIIAALLGTALLIFFLDAILASFEDRYTIVAIMPAAPAIIEGTPVWVGGKEVGTVKMIGFVQSRQDTTANIALTLELPQSVASQVRADSKLRLTSARLIGAPVINIEPGTPAAPLLGPGDTLRAERLLTAEVLIRRAAVARADLDTLMVEVRRLSPLFRRRIRDTREAFTGMQLAMGEAQQITHDLQHGEGIATLRNPEFAASLQRAQAHVAAMPELFEQMRERGRGAGEIGAAVTRLQTRADSLAADLAALSVQFENGTLMRLQRDTALVRALNAARAELDSLMVEARRRPLRFFF